MGGQPPSAVRAAGPGACDVASHFLVLSPEILIHKNLPRRIAPDIQNPFVEMIRCVNPSCQAISTPIRRNRDGWGSGFYCSTRKGTLLCTVPCGFITLTSPVVAPAGTLVVMSEPTEPNSECFSSSGFPSLENRDGWGSQFHRGALKNHPEVRPPRRLKLIVPQRIHGINLGGVASRDIAGEKRHGDQKRRN
jgi:hypothetical protein